MKKVKKKNLGKSAVREWAEAIIIALILALFIRTFFIQAFKIPSGSMMPTLKPGDRILVNKLFYGPRIPILGIRLPIFSKPKRADVIVFVHPGSAEDRDFKTFKRYIDNESLGAVYKRVWLFFTKTQRKDYIKRVISLPEETVQIKGGDIYINGQLVDNSKIRGSTYFNEGSYGRVGQRVRVPVSSYYCLGDNSSSSRDSRYWGFVDEKFLIGKAFLIYWPPTRVRIIK